VIAHDELERLRTEARYHRERRDLYRAKAYGRRLTNPVRLRQLERACALSELRLSRAEQALEEAAPDLPAEAPDRSDEPTARDERQRKIGAVRRLMRRRSFRRRFTLR
jgi:hypothetical protein